MTSMARGLLLLTVSNLLVGCLLLVVADATSSSERLEGAVRSYNPDLDVFDEGNEAAVVEALTHLLAYQGQVDQNTASSSEQLLSRMWDSSFAQVAVSVANQNKAEKKFDPLTVGTLLVGGDALKHTWQAVNALKLVFDVKSQWTKWAPDTAVLDEAVREKSDSLKASANSVAKNANTLYAGAVDIRNGYCNILENATMWWSSARASVNTGAQLLNVGKEIVQQIYNALKVLWHHVKSYFVTETDDKSWRIFNLQQCVLLERNIRVVEGKSKEILEFFNKGGEVKSSPLSVSEMVLQEQCNTDWNHALSHDPGFHKMSFKGVLNGMLKVSNLVCGSDYTLSGDQRDEKFPTNVCWTFKKLNVMEKKKVELEKKGKTLDDLQEKRLHDLEAAAMQRLAAVYFPDQASPPDPSDPSHWEKIGNTMLAKGAAPSGSLIANAKANKGNGKKLLAAAAGKFALLQTSVTERRRRTQTRAQSSDDDVEAMAATSQEPNHPKGSEEGDSSSQASSDGSVDVSALKELAATASQAAEAVGLTPTQLKEKLLDFVERPRKLYDNLNCETHLDWETDELGVVWATCSKVVLDMLECPYTDARIDPKKINKFRDKVKKHVVKKKKQQPTPTPPLPPQPIFGTFGAIDMPMYGMHHGTRIDPPPPPPEIMEIRRKVEEKEKHQATLEAKGCGAVVVRVQEGSAAAAAGLRPCDVVRYTKFGDGTRSKVYDVNSLFQRFAENKSEGGDGDDDDSDDENLSLKKKKKASGHDGVQMTLWRHKMDYNEETAEERLKDKRPSSYEDKDVKIESDIDEWKEFAYRSESDDQRTFVQDVFPDANDETKGWLEYLFGTVEDSSSGSGGHERNFKKEKSKLD